MPTAISKDQPAFKREYRKSRKVTTAMVAAGYSENVAKMGRTALPKTLQQWVTKYDTDAAKLEALGSQINADRQEALMRGRIFQNVIDGVDAACNSVRLGMQDKRVSMLQQDSAIGIIAITLPPAMAQLVAERARTIDALPETGKVLELGSPKDAPPPEHPSSGAK